MAQIGIRGRHVFLGYLNDAEGTAAATTLDGFLLTGDVGIMDDHGFLHITGRAKELIITSGGENVAPVVIEDAVKQAVPFVSNAVVIGNNRKFLVLLVTLKSDWTGPDSEVVVPTAGLGELCACAVCCSTSYSLTTVAPCPLQGPSARQAGARCLSPARTTAEAAAYVFTCLVA